MYYKLNFHIVLFMKIRNLFIYLILFFGTLELKEKKIWQLL